MKKYIKKFCNKLDDILCDVCGESCKKTCDFEHATITATWGYDSKKDLTNHEIDLCESCFDKTIEFLKSIRKNIETNSSTLAYPPKDPLDGTDYYH